MKTLLFILAVCGSAATGRSLPFGIDFKMSLKGAVGQDLTLAQKADPIVVLQFENPTLSAVELRIPAHDSAHRKLPYPYALSAKVSDAAEISPTLDKQWMTQYAIWNTTFDENDPADVAVLQPGGHLHFEVPLFDIIGPWYPHGVERSDYRVRIRYEDEVSQEFHVHK